MCTGFSHSEILGSKLIYQLPEAYRRLHKIAGTSQRLGKTTSTSGG